MTDMPDSTDPDVIAKRRPGADDPDGYTDADITPKDWFLDLLLDHYSGFADDHHGGVGLTLTTAGGVVSGIVISRSEWISRATDRFRESGDAGVADNLADFYGRAHTRAVEEWNRRDAADLIGKARRFIHMRDAKLFNGSEVSMSLWRGSLSDVTGWSFGSWNPPHPSQTAKSPDDN